MDTPAIQDLSAQVDLHGRLLQKLFSTVYHGELDSFELLMDEIAKDLAATGNGSSEAQEDLKVRVAVHLVRFRDATRELM